MKRKVQIGLLVGVTALLAVTGLICMSYAPPYFHVGDLFVRQLEFNLIGVVCAGLLVLCGWRRMLASAPFIMVGLIGLFVWSLYAGTHTGPGCFDFGTICFEACATYLLVSSLLLAYAVRHRLRWFIVVSVLFGLVQTICVFANQAASDANAFAQQQLMVAFAQAKWFGGCGQPMGPTPYAMSAGMVAGVSVVLGKFMLIPVGLAVGTLVATLGWIALTVEDKAKRVFIASSAIFICGQATVAYLQCFGLVPMTRLEIPLAAFGVTATICTWAVVGLATSALLDTGDSL